MFNGDRNMQKKTVGEESRNLTLKSNKKDSTTFIDIQREVHKGTNSKKSYEEEIWECVDRGKKDNDIKDNFYIVVLLKKERLMQNVIRNYFFYRQSCPTPDYDQTVYKYFRKSDEIEYLWTVPDKVTCAAIPILKTSLPNEQMWLLDMIKKFKTGELDKLSSHLNGEYFDNSAV
jgi:hypothetical protein